MRQLIIARKDLQMSPGKLAAQVSHGSMAFLTAMIKNSPYNTELDFHNTWVKLTIPNEVMDWIDGSFVKTVCEARNRNHLEKAITYARELGLEEGKDFFLIRDNCLTELTPEDEDGRTLTCIGFRPLPDEIAHTISHHYQLYR